MNKPQSNVRTYDIRYITEQLSSKLELRILDENINNPTPEIVQQIYLKFLQVALDISENSFTTLPLSVTLDLDSDMFRKSIPIVIINQVMSAFLSDCTDNALEFHMCDLVRPAADMIRFKKLMSFLVDFLRLLPVAKPIFDSVNEEFREKFEEKNKLQDELMVMEERKAELISQQSLRKRRENDLLNEIQKVQEELNGIIKEYTATVSKTEELKKITENTSEYKMRLEMEVKEKKKMKEHLEEEVMDSPDRLKSEMEARKIQIAEIDKSISQLKKTLDKCRNNIEICSHSEKQIHWINEKFSGLSEEKLSVQEIIETVHDDERKLNEIEQNYKFSCEKKEAAIRRMNEMDENHKKTMKEHMDRIMTLKNRVKEIEECIAEMSNNQPKSSNDINEKSAQLVAIKNAFSELKRKEVQECNELYESFSNILKLSEQNEKSSLEHSIATERFNERIKNNCMKSLKDYTFSNSTMDEEEAAQNDDTAKENISSDNVFM